MNDGTAAGIHIIKDITSDANNDAPRLLGAMGRDIKAARQWGVQEVEIRFKKLATAPAADRRG